jgi:hypothetical protein
VSTVVVATLCVRIDDGPQVCIPIRAEYAPGYVEEHYGGAAFPVNITNHEFNLATCVRMSEFWEQFRVAPVRHQTDVLRAD